jgi:putative transposase
VTVIKDTAGRYFASFVVELEPGAMPEAEQVTGVDLGLTHFAVLSDGRKIASSRFLRRAEKNSSMLSVFCPASRKAARTGTRQGSRSLGHMRGWPLPGASSIISYPRH